MPALVAGKTRLVAPAANPRPWAELAAWTCLGLAGCAAVVLSAGQLAGGSVRWWLDPHLSVSGSSAEVILYAGMVALTMAWLGLGRRARSSDLSPGAMWAVAAIWSVPLFLSAPVFSRDVYSYLAQGTILHLGHNPYHDLPVSLAHLGRPQILSAVDPFWRHTTAPYGPLFLETVSAIVGLTGTHVVLGAQLVKLLGLIGLVLIGVCTPRLARAFGYDPVRATWLAILNPLVLFALVIPGHNDLLMVGLMVAGVTLAVEQRPLLGILLCALAAAIKLPALVAAVFIAVAWARSGSLTQERVRRLVLSAGVTVVVLGVVTLVTGVGVSWVTSTLFSAPARVKLAITPSSGLACTVSWLTSACTKGHVASLQPAFRAVVAAIAAVGLLELLRRTRASNLVWCLGLALIVVAWGGPAAWPWYFVWGLALLAALPSARTMAWSIVGIVAGAFVIKPSGQVAIPLQSAPWVMLVYLVALIVAWYSFRNTRRPRLGPSSTTDGPSAGPDGTAQPALAE